ncbi:MAG TPA: ATP synthase F1 subunit epsilon [Candidatus Blautia gallistercoris]|uniref:ATP synthase epsilon chain n=1 Tax=Candidatus Blautia gallistercoris TaxID=2838490 RepID=A0A9D2B214_9FIRM|nr:ATP synthase F1 subunit epsilon [Candidatus Blautia gallistercoris]
MNHTFGLEIIASDKTFYRGRGKILVLPAKDGEKAILANHEDMIIAIVPGVLRFETEDGEKQEAAVSGGFAEVINNRVKVLVLTAERPEEIDVIRAREAKERAEEQLRQARSMQEYHQNQMALARAMTRLRVTRKQEL